jgi:hypothetical protein
MANTKKQPCWQTAYGCGCNSKPTIDRAFKKNTGKSAKEYVKE